jgi:hypothetical protein
MNRWVVASLKPPKDHKVILITDKQLTNLRGNPVAVEEIKKKLVPSDIHSIKLHGSSELALYDKKQFHASHWLNRPPRTTWGQWYDGCIELTNKIKNFGNGSLALIDGKQTYIMGQGPVLAEWWIRPGELGLQEITSLFIFADSLGWNQL